MDRKLVAWARAVKARNRRHGPFPPPLWLFTDSVRLPDPAAAIRKLPRGLAGVVLRGDAADPILAVLLARLCRSRGLPLAVAGSAALAARLRAGRHLRGGDAMGSRTPSFLTSSAHDAKQLRRARQAGAAVIFLSPVFHTASHPGAPILGSSQWSRLSRRDPRVAALGGVDGASVRRLPAWCRHIGAIGALAP